MLFLVSPDKLFKQHFVILLCACFILFAFPPDIVDGTNSVSTAAGLPLHRVFQRNVTEESCAISRKKGKRRGEVKMFCSKSVLENVLCCMLALEQSNSCFQPAKQTFKQCAQKLFFTGKGGVATFQDPSCIRLCLAYIILRGGARKFLK